MADLTSREAARALMRELVQLANADRGELPEASAGVFENWAINDCGEATLCKVKFTFHKSKTEAESIVEFGHDPLDVARLVVGASPWAGRMQ